MTATTLRPMNLGEILDRTFVIYRKKFLLFAALAAAAPIAVVGFRLADILWLHLSARVHLDREGEVFFSFIFVSICYDHFRFLASIPLAPALVNSASKAAFGEQDSIVSSLRESLAHLGRYILIGILKLLTALILPEAFAGGVFWGMAYAADAAGLFKTGSNAPYVIVISVPLAILAVLIAWFGACFSLVFPAAVFERLTWMQAMKRSWVLSRNSRRRIIAVCFLILVFGWVVMLGMQFLFRIAVVLAYGQPQLSPGWHKHYLAGVYSLNAIVIALVGSLYPIATTLIYYDQRIRREGYDIEMMMATAGLSETAAADVKTASVEAAPQETEA